MRKAIELLKHHADLVLSKASLGPSEGGSESYTVALATRPSAEVTVTITGHADTDLTPDPTSLTFTTTDWATAQTVTVEAGHDDDTVNDQATLTHTAAGGGYASVAADLPVTVHDDDEADLVLSKASLGPSEGGSESYTVALATRPSAEVTVTITGHADTDLTPDPTSLTFTTTDWATAQTVTVEAGHDDDTVNDQATLTHTAAGGGYASVAADLPVTVHDDDEADLVLSKASLGPSEGGSESYTVALATRPSAEVTVTITGHADTDLTPDPTSLTFTTTDWATAQTVTVEAGHDDDTVNDQATLTHTAAGGGYASVAADLPVTVHDDAADPDPLMETDPDPLVPCIDNNRANIVTVLSERGVISSPGEVDTWVIPGVDPFRTYFVEILGADSRLDVWGQDVGGSLTLADPHPVSLYHEAGNPGGHGFNSAPGDFGTGGNSRFIFVFSTFGDYVLKVKSGESADDEGTGSYHLLVRYDTYCIENDDGNAVFPFEGGPEGYAFDIRADVSTRFTEYERYSSADQRTHYFAGGHLLGDNWGSEPDEDWYGFELKENTEYEVYLEGSDRFPVEHRLMRPRITGIYNKDGVLFREGEAGSGTDPFVTLTFQTAGSGKYYLGVGSNPGGRTGVYNYRVTQTEPDNAGLAATNNSPTGLVQPRSNTPETREKSSPTDKEDPQNPPPAPKNLTATANSDGSVTLSWEAPDDDSVTGYQVLRRRPREGEKTLLVHVNDTGSTATEYTDRDVTPDVLHAYRVKAINPVGLSGRSNFDNVTPVQPAETVQNSPAKGAPAISGTAQVGETLTVDTSGIADDDGLVNATYRYKWIVSDGGADVDIAGATDSTYTVIAADKGLTIKVRVSFTDDAGNDESLTSAATDEVGLAVRQQEDSNTPASVQPSITGTARVGETLTADISSIADGLTNASFSYQWVAGESDIDRATGSTYTLTVSEQGKTIEVNVTVTDDAGNEATLTSRATDAVEAAP